MEPTPRDTMIEEHLAARGISDARVLAAMRRVPRERFVSPALRDAAYDDRALPIEEGQTISQPYVVALMAEALALAPTDRLLEVGAGSGYAAAVYAELAAQVFTIERHEPLATSARARLHELGFDNVVVLCGDGTLGVPAHAPYQAISVAAAAEQVPPALVAQLAVGGRLVMPVGKAELQHLLRLTKVAPNEVKTEDLGAVAFVPLVAGRRAEEVGGDVSA